ncbi:sigma-54 interaction domain-containing protein [Aneurinibacillus terranovensis]|uniref:sigma-54 interaction domain-containing protein n=1 Tax=Aneurinibacillus terranovensis TaxID=278991 RepID=UPI00040AD34C|nr:sigma 54-interacting transcriptional regulator [Aneurinibacillus terranovensis]
MKETIQELYESELLLRNLIDNSYDAIYITDEKGKTAWYNKAFLRISGLSPSQLDGYTVFELLEKGWLPNSVVAEVIQQKKAFTSLINYYNGSEGLVSATPVMDDSGNLLHVIANVRDLTELNELKRQLDDTKALNESYRQTLQEVQSTGVEGNRIIFRSSVMENIVSLAHKVALVDTPVVIFGESGVGKDILAKYIHYLSERHKKGTFVKVNCGAIPEHLLESELFGYEAGSFTGAGRHGKAGLFQVANNGTIFLDEIGEMPLALQVKLLGVLQDMEIQRVGGTKPIPINVRVITATNANLEKMMHEKKFRHDLFYRINVLTIHIPPLRERSEDIFDLLLHYLDMFNKKYKVNKTFSPDVIEQLLSYEWPGNVRELKNIVERLVVMSDSDIIEVNQLPGSLQQRKIPDHHINLELPSFTSIPGQTLKQLVSEQEKQILSYYLSTYRPMKRCAEVLGVDLATLVRKKKRYGL